MKSLDLLSKKTLLLLVTLSLSSLAKTDAWLTVDIARSSATFAFAKRCTNVCKDAAFTTTQLYMGGVEPTSLDLLGTDHEQVGNNLAGSIQRWLDYEWMPQNIHTQIGESAKSTYVTCRKKGVDDIGTILIQVADDLNKDWMKKYNKDAFVNAWDVANYVSDYLTQMSGSEGCECSAKIH